MPASLLGVWTAGESTAALTLTGRTSTAGSLITVTPGVWPGSGGGTSLATPTDSNGNTYTELAEIDFDSAVGENGWGSLAYNNAGTRGASHTISEADNGANSLGAQEWSGIAASPTIVTGAQAQGTSTAPSASATLAVTSLLILVFGYTGTSTTFDVNDGTLAQEIDENSDQQDVGVHYKVSQASGSQSITATLAASRNWGARVFGFEESAGGVASVAARPQSRPFPFAPGSSGMSGRL